MSYTLALLQLFLLGYSVSLVMGQEPSNEPGEPIGVEHAAISVGQQQQGGEAVVGGGDDEPEEINAMQRLQNVTSIEEFLALLEHNGHPVERGDVLANYTEGDKVMISTAGGKLAQPDDCSPRDTTVRLTFDNSNPNVVYFPRCTKIERCGGCCPSPNLECVPSYTERVSLKVIKADVPSAASSHFEWKGEFASVIIDRHVNCRVQCTLNQDKCGMKKEFLERQCECRCRAYGVCQPPHVWDPEECGCKCAEVLTCCCGLVFRNDTCECGLDTGIQHIRHEASSPNPQREDSTTTSTTTRSTTMTTTTTTTPGVITTDPCPGVNCPSHFVKQLDPTSGMCRCRPTFGSRPRSRNGPSP